MIATECFDDEAIGPAPRIGYGDQGFGPIQLEVEPETLNGDDDEFDFGFDELGPEPAVLIRRRFARILHRRNAGVPWSEVQGLNGHASG